MLLELLLPKIYFVTGWMMTLTVLTLAQAEKEPEFVKAIHKPATFTLKRKGASTHNKQSFQTIV